MNNLEAQTDHILLGILLVITAVVGGYIIYYQNNLEARLAETTADLASSTAANADLHQQITTLNGEITDLQNDLEEAEEELEDEQERNNDLEERVEEVNDSIGTLEQTVSTDPELLKKYSRTFFLSENYTPSELTEIDDEYVYGDKELEFHEKAWPDLEDMLEAAEDDDIELRIISAYRPFGQQAALNESYTRIYGSGANQFSAEQGYSEHQLGTTIDFTTPQTGNNFETFGQTQAFEWLQENAHEYGFILSYPQGNQYYIFEPWHWRFVGEELANDLEDDNAHFYDWSQREIDTYRSELFD